MSRPQIFSQVLQDVRYGGRMLSRHPGATAIIVLSLAPGVSEPQIRSSSVWSTDSCCRRCRIRRRID